MIYEGRQYRSEDSLLRGACVMQAGQQTAGRSHLLVDLLERTFVFMLVLHEVTHANDLV